MATGLSSVALDKLRQASGGAGSLLGYGDWQKYAGGGGTIAGLGGMSMSDLYSRFGVGDINALMGGGGPGGGAPGVPGATPPTAPPAGGTTTPEPPAIGAMAGIKRAVARGAGGAGLGQAAEGERLTAAPTAANPYLGVRLYPQPGMALTQRGFLY